MVSLTRSRSVFSLLTAILTLAAFSSHSSPVAARGEAAAAAETATMRLRPEDTSLNLDAINHSADALLTTYTWPDYQAANAVVMKFDLSRLPAGALITGATLHLALVESDTQPDTTYVVSVHKLLGRNPVIGNATGYTADGVTAWTPSTCCFDGVPLAQADISPAYDRKALGKANGFKSWNVTALVQEWLADPDSNFGLLLNSDSTKAKDRYRYFASMEHPDTTLRPFLRVTYTAGDATPPSVRLTSPTAGATLGGTVQAAADAIDDVGVAALQFQLDGAAIGAELTSPPYVAQLDTSAVSDGTHILAAVARDWAGNAATSEGARVTVQNGVMRLALEDTWLNVDANNYSRDTTLLTYTWPDYKAANAILMKADLTTLPQGAVVTDATLHLALVESDSAADAAYAVSVHKVRGRNPVLSRATGFTADGIAPWTPSTCCYNAVPLAHADIAPAADRQLVDKNPGIKSWTVTSIVQDWLADPATNFGLLLDSDSSKPRDRYRFFASMEHPDASLRPYLTVRYFLRSSSDATPPSVTITTPAQTSTVSRAISIAAAVSDDDAIAGVQFKLDGAPLGPEVTAAPFVITWDTTLAADGDHALTATARDVAGNVSTSNAVMVTADNAPPAIANVAASSPTGSGATITWTTAEPGDTQVEYGPTTAYGSSTLLSAALVSAHSVTLTGMPDGRLYHFRVRSRDAAGNAALSGDFTFSTLDVTRPSVALTSPAAGVTASGTVTLTANASDNVAVAGVRFKVDGVTVGTEDLAAPYSRSWTTTAVADGSHTLTAVARDAAGNTVTSAAVAVTVSNTVAPPPNPISGISALYPGDVGIEAHPDVVFVERFEEATVGTVFSRWSDVLNGSAMSLGADVPPGSPGTRSLNIPWVGGGVNDGGHLYKQLTPGIDDTLYVRYYIKYPTSGKFHHTGVWMGGSNPALPWPNPQAGTKPVGNDRFIAAAEQNMVTTGFDHYNYWMNMRQSGDGNYWGNFLLNNPALDAQPGAWTCVEHMVKLNNPVSAFNGEHAIWLNGVKVSHLGPGFPNGRWVGGIFTQDPGGTPFEGFRWRSDAALNLNWIWLQNYSPDDPAGFSGNMKFDHVVVARSPVGCLAAGAPVTGDTSATTTPPVVSVVSPSSGMVVSGTINVSATATASLGVTSVQFKVDGVNLGAEDSIAPYAVSWDTRSATNGSHTVTAVVKDASGNTATAPASTVTVSNAPTSGWPNEPTGMTLLTDWGLDQTIPTSGDVVIPGSPNWRVVANAPIGSAGGYAQRVTDASAPVSPSNVYDFVYPQGMIEGEAPATVFYNVSADELYAGFWWKPSSPFDPGPNGNKIAFMFNGGGDGGGQQFIILMPDKRLHVLPEYPGDYRWRTPNVTPTVVTLGVWHRIEWYANRATGAMKWWLDGVLQGSYTDVRSSHRFDMFQFSPTWGGNSGYRKPQTDHYWFDHVHLSGR